MCLDLSNQLNQPYEAYQATQVVKLCREIAPARRKGLAAMIAVRASVMGCSNDKALKAALKNLKEDK